MLGHFFGIDYLTIPPPSVMFYLGPAEWLCAVIQGFASELKSVSVGVESRSREEAPSLLHSADNFNI